MKKFILISIIAVAAMGMIGCGEEDGTKADLRWKNKYSNNVSTIKWISNSKEDQTWDGTYDTTLNSTTGYRGINELSGSGECLFAGGSGVPEEIELDNTDPEREGIAVDGNQNVVITENAAATLIIKQPITK